MGDFTRKIYYKPQEGTIHHSQGQGNAVFLKVADIVLSVEISSYVEEESRYVHVRFSVYCFWLGFMCSDDNSIPSPGLWVFSAGHSCGP